MALETQKIIQAITPYMRKCLFKRKRKYFYKILENLVFCVEFEKPGELIYVHYYVVPLYIPHECRSFTYGNRVIVNSNHIVFKPTREVDDGDIIECISRIQGYIQMTVLPLFDAVSTPRKLVDAVTNNVDNMFFCTDIDVLRLQLFTYAFLGEYKNFWEIGRKYRRLLQGCTFLSNPVIEKYSSEIEKLQFMVHAGTMTLSKWFDETIHNTLTSTL